MSNGTTIHNRRSRSSTPVSTLKSRLLRVCGVIVTVAAMFAMTGCGGNDAEQPVADLVEPGEVVKALEATDLTIKYRKVEVPRDQPIQEAVAGTASNSFGTTVNFAVVVYEDGAIHEPGSRWYPVVFDGGDHTTDIGNALVITNSNSVRRDGTNQDNDEISIDYEIVNAIKTVTDSRGA